MAQSVKSPTLHFSSGHDLTVHDHFSSGHDLTVHEFKPQVGLWTVQILLGIVSLPSLCPYSTCSLSLKVNTLKKIKITYHFISYVKLTAEYRGFSIQSSSIWQLSTSSSVGQSKHLIDIQRPFKLSWVVNLSKSQERVNLVGLLSSEK